MRRCLDEACQARQNLTMHTWPCSWHPGLRLQGVCLYKSAYMSAVILQEGFEKHFFWFLCFEWHALSNELSADAVVHNQSVALHCQYALP